MKSGINRTAEKIVVAAIDVHRELGPGLLESAYEAAMAFEVGLRGVPFERQKPQPVRDKGLMIEVGYRMDVLVDDAVVVELKAVESLLPIHEAQLLTSLKLANKRVGLLINFNVPLRKQGIVRLGN